VGRGGGSVLSGCMCSFAFTSAVFAVAPPQVNPMFARVNQKGEILNPELAVSEVDTAGGGPGLFPSPFTFPSTSPDCELPATECHHVACGGAGLRSA
jgi:hypothetical protein